MSGRGLLSGSRARAGDSLLYGARVWIFNGLGNIDAEQGLGGCERAFGKQGARAWCRVYCEISGNYISEI